jgi:hypothetical protein
MDDAEAKHVTAQQSKTATSPRVDVCHKLDWCFPSVFMHNCFPAPHTPRILRLGVPVLA